MNTTSPEALSAQLAWRYATKKFDSARKIPDGAWQALERSFLLAPSSFGLQPWKFVVVTDPALKAQLPGISWNQQQPKDCSHLVVFAARRGLSAADVDRHLAHAAAVRGAPIESLAGYREMMVGFITRLSPEQLNAWADRQTYIALGFLLSAAAMLGVDATPMEGIDGPAYDKLLGVDKAGCASLAACALGYRAADDQYAKAPKVRYSDADVIIRR